MTSTPEVQATTARLTLWRVFGLLDDFSDGPKPYWRTDAAVKSSPTCNIAVTIGEVPEELLTTLKQWRAQLQGNLSLKIGQSLTPDQRLEMYHHALGTVQIREFEEPYVAWLTVRVTRLIDVALPVDGELDWGTNAQVINDALIEFEEQGNPLLDCAIASVIGAAEGLNIRHLRFAGRRPYVTAAGKAAITIAKSEMKIKDSGLSVGRNDGWAAAPTDQITAAISSAASVTVTKTLSKLIGQPMSWLCSAMSEETDDLRRFTFAFAGLELLVTQFEKNGRGDLIAMIEDLDQNLPVTELLWPSTNEDVVWRNLVFRFAVMATQCAPGEAKRDVASFKPVAKARNDMFHGSEQSITRELSIECERLLRKYIKIVALRQLVS